GGVRGEQSSLSESRVARGGVKPQRDPLLPFVEERRREPAGTTSKVHKPHLDEMHGPESLPYRPDRARHDKPFGSGSKIFQPPNPRESGPEFGPAPRSTGGAPGKRGGWKRRR